MDVVIYARLSQEDERARPGEATATERQIADCRAEAARRGWTVRAVYEDPDHSASDLHRKRPEFERMLGDLRAGMPVDAVLCAKLDRLLRHPREAERIIELADQRGFGIVSLNDPGIDLTTPTGRAMFRMTIAWAKLETETMSLRLRRKARDIAESGRANGGGVRPFGLTPGARAIVPEEAALVRDAAARLLAGESLYAIAMAWNAAGVRTPGRKATPAGRHWESSSLKRMLTAPRIVGDRTLHGVVVGHGAIPALLERDTWERLCAVLAAPRGRQDGTTVRRHYLTGLAACGRCGAKLTARADAQGIVRYVCAQPRGCGGISVAKHNIEPLIAEAIAVRLDSDALRAAFARRIGAPGDAPDLEQLRADEQALEEAATAYFVERAISKAEYTAVRGQLKARIEASRRHLERSTREAGLARLTRIDVRREWDQHPAPWRHDVARTLIERVTVNPAPKRGARFDPGRITIEWRA